MIQLTLWATSCRSNLYTAHLNVPRSWNSLIHTMKLLARSLARFWLGPVVLFQASFRQGLDISLTRNCAKRAGWIQPPGWEGGERDGGDMCIACLLVSSLENGPRHVY